MARLVKAVDFEKVLQRRSRATTPHFALHHLVGAPAGLSKAAPEPRESKLSTSTGTSGAAPVDELSMAAQWPPSRWLGAVVPKRHARRAVTRALLKRQIYAAAERHCDHLAGGLWIVRQRAPFDRSLFPSAASDALKRSARDELDALFEASTRSAAAPAHPAPSP